MQLTDEQWMALEIQRLIYGFDTYETDYFATSSYKKLRTTLLNYLPTENPENFIFMIFPKSEILQAGKYVIDKHFESIDLQVYFTTRDDIASQVNTLFGQRIISEQYDEVIDYINNQLELVRVTDIPVYLTDSKGGYVDMSYFRIINMLAEEDYRQLPRWVSKIVLSNHHNINTKCSYVHEMMHALASRHNGNIRNLLNDEVLSIFMEKVAAYDIDQSGNSLDLKNLDRILYLKYAMISKELHTFTGEEVENILEYRKYIISSLHATALFNTYMKGNSKVKKEIDEAIGRVLMGEDVLEDMLAHYEASLDKGTKIMRKQIKKYHKKYMS